VIAESQTTDVRIRWGPWFGFLAVAAGLLYLVNPGAGVLELLPDGAPLVGNLDEAAATAFLILGLRLVFARPRTA
jgi:hypothetical protein